VRGFRGITDVLREMVVSKNGNNLCRGKRVRRDKEGEKEMYEISGETFSSRGGARCVSPEFPGDGKMGVG